MPKAWSIAQTGSIDKLLLKDITLPPLAPGHVLVRTRALGLNFADVFSVLGLYSATPKGEFIPGLEYSGVVEAVAEGEGEGKDAPPFKVGDRVFGVTRFGAFTTHINADVRYLRKIPDGWSFEEGASFLVQMLTAYYGLRDLANMREGQSALVHSAAGGVGIMAIMLLKKIGGKFVGTVSSQEKADFLIERFGLEPHQVIVRTQGGGVFEQQLDEALAKIGSPEGFDVIFESLGGEYFWPSYRKTASGGRLVIFGSGSLMPSGNLGSNIAEWLKLGYKFARRPTVDPLQLMTDNKSVMGFNLIWLYDKISMLTSSLEEIERMGFEPPVVGKTFPFSELPEALKYFRTGRNVGKVVVTVGEGEGGA